MLGAAFRNSMGKSHVENVIEPLISPRAGLPYLSKDETDQCLHVHQLHLQSAYSSMPIDSNTALGQQQESAMDPRYREPRFTNCTTEYKGTLDYILYSSESLHPVSLLELPTGKDCQVMEKSGLPNPRYPSDHICLQAEFELIPKQRR